MASVILEAVEFVGAARFRAMLFDPSVESATLMQATLAKARIEVVEWATSGSGWVTAWHKAKVDLVVVEYVLPKRDGVHVIEKIHELNPTCALLMTHSFQGWAANTIELKAFSVGVGGILQKPIAEERLIRITERVLLAARKNKAPTRFKMPR